MFWWGDDKSEREREIDWWNESNLDSMGKSLNISLLFDGKMMSWERENEID